MRLLVIVFAFVLSVEVTYAQTDYSARDSVFIEKALSDADTVSSADRLPLFFAQRFLGKPYVAHTLEKHDREHLIINTNELDCTTLVENVVALTVCATRNRHSFADFTTILTNIRYRGGKINGYPSRLHYFSDWIIDNTKKGFIQEVPPQKPPFTAVQRLNISYMTKHSKAYKALRAHPDFIPEIAAQERDLTGRTYRYIPKTEVKNTKLMRDVVRNGDIIAIVSNKTGLDIAHLGVAVWKSDGLHLLNASMIHQKVVDEPMTLFRYLQQHKSHLGIRVIRISNKH